MYSSVLYCTLVDGKGVQAATILGAQTLRAQTLRAQTLGAQTSRAHTLRAQTLRYVKWTVWDFRMDPKWKKQKTKNIVYYSVL